MARPSVSLSIPPHAGGLEVWGRDVGGEWWALVVWTVQVSPHGGGHPHMAWCAAWVPARQVSLDRQHVDYLPVHRIQLGAEAAEWPGPRNRPGAVWEHKNYFYLGVLRDGEAPRLPAGAGRPWGKEQGGAYG